MARMLTFLGKGGTGRTTVAIAAAKYLAGEGQRVLLASSDPALDVLLDAAVTSTPQEMEANFSAVKFQTATLLEQNWEDLKQLEAEYLRTPFFKDVYGQELGVLPGMDSALALNAIRQYVKRGAYDVVIYDGAGNLETLRALGMPEILSWYFRRFQNLLADSDIGRALSPFIQPVSMAVLNVDRTGENFVQPLQRVANELEDGKQTVADPNRAMAYLVTTVDPAAIATARYLWGSAQQIGLTISGVLCNQTVASAALTAEFAPLPVASLPTRTGTDWTALVQAMPDVRQSAAVPLAMEIDVAAGQVRLFLPGFDKTQVKLTQYGPEVTVEAGDQRRNLALPVELRGKSVKGAKFQDRYLILSFT